MKNGNNSRKSKSQSEASCQSNSAITVVFSQLLMQATGLCQSLPEAETIVQDVIRTLNNEDNNSAMETGGDGQEEEEDDDDDDEKSGVATTTTTAGNVVTSTQSTIRDVWNAICNYLELDHEERTTAFEKCRDYCRNEKRRLPADFVNFFLESPTPSNNDTESSSSSSSSDSLKDGDDADEDDEEDDSDDESSYYFMNNGESYCELCERSNMKLTKHHLIPKSTWPRIRIRLRHALEAMERGHVNKADIILGGGANSNGNLSHVLTTVLSASSGEATTTTTTPMVSSRCSSHKRSKPQQPAAEKDEHMSRNSRRIRILRRALSYTCNICRQCHSMYAMHDNMTLGLEYNTVEKLLQDPTIAKYCRWASKQRAGKYCL